MLIKELLEDDYYPSEEEPKEVHKWTADQMEQLLTVIYEAEPRLEEKSNGDAWIGALEYSRKEDAYTCYFTYLLNGTKATTTINFKVDFDAEYSYPMIYDVGEGRIHDNQSIHVGGQTEQGEFIPGESVSEAKTNLIPVPDFKSSKEATDYLASLGIDDAPDGDVLDPDTGELYYQKGEKYITKRKSEKEWGKKQTATNSQMKKDDARTNVEWFKDFNEFYNVITYKLEDFEDWERMMELDYDMDALHGLPKTLKRKDGEEMSSDDIATIRDTLNDILNDMHITNIKLTVSTGRKNKVAITNVEFH